MNVQELYRVTVPVYVQFLKACSGVLDKAAAHAEAHKIEPAALLDARLFPDMWPFRRQVQAASNHAVRGSARLGGVELPTLSEAAASFADLKQRLAETVTFVQGVDPAAIVKGFSREITFPMGNEQRTMTGERYFLSISLPNFFFHLTTAYDILRHNGVPLGKADFTGG